MEQLETPTALPADSAKTPVKLSNVALGDE